MTTGSGGRDANLTSGGSGGPGRGDRGGDAGAGRSGRGRADHPGAASPGRRSRRRAVPGSRAHRGAHGRGGLQRPDGRRGRQEPDRRPCPTGHRRHPAPRHDPHGGVQLRPPRDRRRPPAGLHAAPGHCPGRPQRQLRLPAGPSPPEGAGRGHGLRLRRLPLRERARRSEHGPELRHGVPRELPPRRPGQPAHEDVPVLADRGRGVHSDAGLRQPDRLRSRRPLERPRHPHRQRGAVRRLQPGLRRARRRPHGPVTGRRSCPWRPGDERRFRSTRDPRPGRCRPAPGQGRLPRAARERGRGSDGGAGQHVRLAGGARARPRPAHGCAERPGVPGPGPGQCRRARRRRHAARLRRPGPERVARRRPRCRDRLRGLRVGALRPREVDVGRRDLGRRGHASGVDGFGELVRRVAPQRRAGGDDPRQGIHDAYVAHFEDVWTHHSRELDAGVSAPSASLP